ncbi:MULTISPECIES: hypothetical protein [Pseudomonas]|uniref:Uncharacterized protein n=1 Tax=Pseudomonas vancouverensis TaxID=95300 RepID=A0A1H2MDJ7_PSEVA|nr:MULTISPECIES: hypothetical protein [Pseudomonas]KAB0499117.1 hypothetical protein F7R09_07380 [Pseudomonas vancouverensis]TDB57813.1 hypothetical protein EIY72_26550 [Pseudomonas vancouverensis]SDU91202.1 hypothetical protein SAMN05216558_0593 [Pseudomonas vancouverensis]
MNYKSEEYIKQYNEELGKDSHWEIQQCNDEEHEGFFAIYHMNTHPSDPGKAVLIGYISIATPVETLIGFESLCHDYYNCGQMVGIKSHVNFLLGHQNALFAGEDGDMDVE